MVQLVGQDDAVPAGVVDDAAAMVRRAMDDVARAVSRFRVDSEIEAVNDAAPRLVPVGPLALDLVEEATPAPAVGQDVGAVGSTAAQQR